jgi:hypothetical protein
MQYGALWRTDFACRKQPVVEAKILQQKTDGKPLGVNYFLDTSNFPRNRMTIVLG